MNSRRAFWTLSLLPAFVLAIVACGDDETTGPGPTSDGGPDSLVSDTSTGSDVSTLPDSSGVDGASDASDAGSTVVTTLGSTGVVEMKDIFAQAFFYEDDTVIRASDAPECVAFLRSASKPRSPAGTITIGGPSVGMDGGPPSTITMNPDPQAENFYFHPNKTYPSGADTTVQVEMTSTPAFPTLTVQSLKTPPSGVLTITAPAKPDGGAAPDGEKLKIKSNQPFKITWTPPGGASADQHVVVEVLQLVPDDGGYRLADLRCGYPLPAGSGTVPASLLTEVKMRLGGQSSGITNIDVGGMKQVKTGVATYLLKVTAGAPKTTFINEGPVFTVLE